MDLAALKSEVDADPTSKGYAAHLPDAPGAVVDLLNAQTESTVRPLPCTAAMAWAASGPYSAIVDASNSSSHPLRASCLVLREAFAAGVDIHVELPEMQGMLAAWVSAELITQAQHDSLMTRASKPASRAEILGFGYVNESDLHAALGAQNDNG